MSNQAFDVFKGQDLLTISLETSNDSTTDADSAKIYYQKPSGSKGVWSATIDGTKVNYNVQTGDIDESGVWQFQAVIVIGGKESPGKKTTVTFSESLKP